jgi:tetratricopeptide (TPR) repeat protein
MRAFISYSSHNRRTALRLAEDLTRAKVKVWLDRDQLRKGDPLLDALQEALSASSHLLLLWSEGASESRYVKAEWQAAYDLEKEIIPCLLDDTPLPIFLRRMLFCSLQPSYAKALPEIIKALKGEPSRAIAKASPTPAPTAPKPRSPADRQATVQRLIDGQNEVLDALRVNDLAKAKRLQAELDPITKDALRRWRTDDATLNLGGYHLKNAYQIKYWNKMGADERPPDPILGKAEQLFHAALAIQPDDPSAKNGLGNIYGLRKDYDAAEFFVKHAIEKARKLGIRYDAAEMDLKWIREEKASKAVRRP